MLSREHQRRKTQMGTMAPTPLAIGAIDNRPQYMRNTLFLNQGDETYAEIAPYSDVQASEWTWSAAFLDIDLDGFEDLLMTTGNFYDAQDSDTDELIRLRVMSGFSDYRQTIFMYPSLELPNFAFRNRGDLTFEETGAAWGFNSTDISHGMAFGDFDNDGDLDVVTNRFDTTAGVYRNETAAPRLAVRLRGLPPNTQGVGAKIRVAGGPVPQEKEVLSGGFYLSGADPLYVFAAGKKENALSIEVVWRNGKRSLVANVEPNRIYEIDEPAATAAAPANHTAHSTPPYFEEVSGLIAHTHHEDPYDDFSRQPLLPNRLSQLGPGVAWHDLDGDGDDDLIITSGKGGHPAFYRNARTGNDGKGGFQLWRDPVLSRATQQDQTAVLAWSKAGGTTGVLVAHSNFEEAPTREAFVFGYDLRKGAAQAPGKLSGDLSSPGPMAMADYDGDGDLERKLRGRHRRARLVQPSRLVERRHHRRFRRRRQARYRRHQLGIEQQVSRGSRVSAADLLRRLRPQRRTRRC
jgi:hypothetical protein